MNAPDHVTRSIFVAGRAQDPNAPLVRVNAFLRSPLGVALVALLTVAILAGSIVAHALITSRSSRYLWINNGTYLDQHTGVLYDSAGEPM